MLGTLNYTAIDDFEGRMNLSGLGQYDEATANATAGTSAGVLTEFGSTLADLAKTYVEWDLQRAALDVNLARAQQGLPALDLSTYGAGVQVGVAPSAQNAMIVVAAIIGGAILLGQFTRKR